MKNKAHIIYNPLAGAGSGKKAVQTIASFIAGTGWEHRYFETQRSGDGIRLAQQSAEAGAHLVIAVGGDGAINEVVNGLMLAKATGAETCELAIVNCGTGAGFAQSLGLPQKYEEQIRRAFNRPARPLDIGKLDCYNREGTLLTRYFINECQAGISSAIVSNVGWGKKQLGGKLAFGLTAFVELFRYRAVPVEVALDGRVVQAHPLLGIVVGNGRYCAGGMQLTPGALPNDGLLDVLLIHEMSLSARISAFSKVYSGEHIYSPHITLYKASHIAVRNEKTWWVETDGEIAGLAPCSISVEPAALPVRC
jgi:YegS/Rv2252/BmrU family lipid kinase